MQVSKHKLLATRPPASRKGPFELFSAEFCPVYTGILPPFALISRAHEFKPKVWFVTQSGKPYWTWAAGFVVAFA